MAGRWTDGSGAGTTGRVQKVTRVEGSRCLAMDDCREGPPPLPHPAPAPTPHRDLSSPGTSPVIGCGAPDLPSLGSHLGLSCISAPGPETQQIRPVTDPTAEVRARCVEGGPPALVPTHPSGETTALKAHAWEAAECSTEISPRGPPSKVSTLDPQEGGPVPLPFPSRLPLSPPPSHQPPHSQAPGAFLYLHNCPFLLGITFYLCELPSKSLF